MIYFSSSRARVELCPALNCSFWLHVAFGFLVLPRQIPQAVSALGTLLGSSSPLGNLQTAFALLSLAASVVNKKNKKNFRAHPFGMLWPGLLPESPKASLQPPINKSRPQQLSNPYSIASRPTVA